MERERRSMREIEEKEKIKVISRRKVEKEKRVDKEEDDGPTRGTEGREGEVE